MDVFDIVAVMLGIFFTIRKLDAQSRRPEEFAHVQPQAFLAWQRREVGVYALAVWGCFLKVFVDLGFTFFVAEHLEPGLVRLIGATIDLSWLALVLVSLVRATSTRKQRQRLGIVLGGLVVSERDKQRGDDE